MGYRIAYSSGGASYQKVKERRGNRFLLTLGFFALFWAVTSSLWPLRWQEAKDYLIPGDPAVTKAAFSQMTQQLADGESLEVAVVDFCREVIQGAETSG